MDKYSMTRFNKAPTIYKGRTRFDLSHDILTTFNTGELVPILCEPVNPGETFSLNTTSLTRLETTLHQTMDNAYLEFAFFFVPSRILWNHFPQYQGFNTDAWALETEYTKPQIILAGPGANNVVTPGSLLNHLAVPAGQYLSKSSPNRDDALHIDALPLRAVFACYNEYFRNPNLDSIVYFDDGDDDITLLSGFLFNGSSFRPGLTNLKVNRFPDAFSRALPAPQKGNPVSLSLSGVAPVVTGEDNHDASGHDLMWYQKTGSGLSSDDLHFILAGIDGSSVSQKVQDLGIYDGGSRVGDPSFDGSNVSAVPANLYADLTNISAVTINELRLAIALQSIKERDARTGNKLKDKLAAVWHVDAPSLELDQPEFLGGKRVPINMMEVLQTSETGTTVLGTDAGHSKTIDSDDSFIKSFTQWGYIIGFCFVRTARSYSQGIDRKFFVENILDEYDPMLDNTGEVDVKNAELQATLANTSLGVSTAKEAFGFQENWYWLKERQNRFSGYFQSGINGTLDSWHYGDDYDGVPLLSAAWSKEGTANVDRTIAVQSDYAFQWRINVHFDLKATRPMGKYSIPNTFGF